MPSVDRVGVVGLGQMGAGIAEVFARSGIAVVGVEPEAEALDRGRGHLQRSTDRMVARGRMTAEQRDEVLGRVTFTTAMTDLTGCGLVVEAVPERMPIKRAVFAELDTVCDAGTILATNTSSLSVTEIAATTARADRVVGMHFFNPAPVMKLVEVIRTVRTDPAVVAAVETLARDLGKTPVSVTDRAGFVANALLLGYLNHAAVLLERQVATRDEIDAAMKVGAGLPMGPLALMDLIGLDTVVEILDVMRHETGRARYVAAPLLRRMVAAGLLGNKTGGGFRRPDEAVPGSDSASDSVPDPKLTDRLLLPHLADALAMVADRYASADDVDAAMTLGCGYPVGPIAMLDARGAGAVHDGLARIVAETDDPVDPPPALLSALAGAGRGVR